MQIEINKELGGKANWWQRLNYHFPVTTFVVLALIVSATVVGLLYAINTAFGLPVAGVSAAGALVVLAMICDRCCC